MVPAARAVLRRREAGEQRHADARLAVRRGDVGHPSLVFEHNVDEVLGHVAVARRLDLAAQRLLVIVAEGLTDGHGDGHVVRHNDGLDRRRREREELWVPARELERGVHLDALRGGHVVRPVWVCDRVVDEPGTVGFEERDRAVRAESVQVVRATRLRDVDHRDERREGDGDVGDAPQHLGRLGQGDVQRAVAEDFERGVVEHSGPDAAHGEARVAVGRVARGAAYAAQLDDHAPVGAVDVDVGHVVERVAEGGDVGVVAQVRAVGEVEAEERGGGIGGVGGVGGVGVVGGVGDVGGVV